MVNALASYQRLQATWPAIRVACAFLAKVKEVEVDLGLVMGRFHLINGMREKRGVPKELEPRFRELVRASSEAIAERKYGEAHQKLEDLFVLFGETSKPAKALEAIAPEEDTSDVAPPTP